MITNNGYVTYEKLPVTYIAKQLNGKIPLIKRSANIDK